MLRNNDNRKSKFKVFRRQIGDLQANSLTEFVDFCCNDIVSKSLIDFLVRLNHQPRKGLLSFRHTIIIISYSVEVQILVEVLKKYLFRSPYTRKATIIRWSFFLFLDCGIEDSHRSAEHLARRGVRICRAERVKLACKRQATKIFTQSVNTPVSHKRLAIPAVLCYTNHRKAVGLCCFSTTIFMIFIPY